MIGAPEPEAAGTQRPGRNDVVLAAVGLRKSYGDNEVVRGLDFETQGPDHLNTGIARIKLGRSLLRQSRFAEARARVTRGVRRLWRSKRVRRDRIPSERANGFVDRVRFARAARRRRAVSRCVRRGVVEGGEAKVARAGVHLVRCRRAGRRRASTLRATSGNVAETAGDVASRLTLPGRCPPPPLGCRARLQETPADRRDYARRLGHPERVGLQEREPRQRCPAVSGSVAWSREGSPTRFPTQLLQLGKSEGPKI